MQQDTKAVFSAILKTFKGNKLMTDTREDGIYIRLAGKESKGEIFSLNWWKVFDFRVKTNTCRHAEIELDILSKSATDPENRPVIEPFRNEILALCEAFGNSGQSGGSAPYTATAIAQAIKKLLLQEPICPIMGIDDEWNHIREASETDEMMYQNKRCSALFKGKDGRCWYLDAIVWKTQNGGTWSGSAFLQHGVVFIKYLSRQYIKSFPFTPKTFYIDVIEKEVAKDDWEFHIKSEAQLKKVFKYYDRYL